MLLRRKLFLSGVVLSVLLCFSIVSSAKAASMWSRTYGGAADEKAYSLVATSDGGYAIAGATAISGGAIWSTKADAFFNGDFWLIKTDAFGNTEWNKTYGTDRVEIAYSLAAASDGGYPIPGRADRNFWLFKPDEFGNM